MSLAHTSFLPVARLNFNFFQYQPTDEVIFNTFLFVCLFLSNFVVVYIRWRWWTLPAESLIISFIKPYTLFDCFLSSSTNLTHITNCLELSSSSSSISRLDVPATWKIYFSWTRWWAVISVNVFFCLNLKLYG